MRYLFTIAVLLLAKVACSQSADFSFQSPSGVFCVPAAVQFSQQSGNNPVGFVWEFGDGGYSNSSNPVHTYTAAGIFQVKLIVIYAQTTSTVIKTVEINPANKINLGVDRNYICKPGDVSFVAAGTDEIRYEWDFGDGNTDVTPGGNTTHFFNDYQKFNIAVKATDQNGCQATASAVVEVKEPAITASYTTGRGCIPATSGFTATVSVPKGSSVSAYNWDFGDGNTTVTTVNSTSHTYSSVGQYAPHLSIVTSEGCSSAYDFPVVAYGTPPVNISASPVKDPVCASDAATFVVSAQNANQYKWQFGDGTSLSSSATQVTHKYLSLGTKSVTVVPLENGCPGSPANFNVDIIGVIASFDYKINCSQRNVVTFTDLSTGNITSFLWNYGDGETNDSVASGKHTFPISGTFTTSLKVDDNVTGCSDVFQRTIYTAAPLLINPDDTLCRNESTTFTLQNNYSNPSSKYTFHVGGTVIGPSGSTLQTMRPSKFGVFNNFVVIDNGPQYCLDTAYLDHPILVRGPALNFDIDSSICFYDSTLMVNKSYSFLPGDSIQTVSWKADDSTFSNQFQPASFKFTKTGGHAVVLYATDDNGCQDSLRKNLVVNAIPFLRVIPEADTLCAGDTSTLIAFHNEPVLWSSPQPLVCNSCDTLIAAPAVSTYYAVEARSKAGCYARDTINVLVHSPFKAVALNPYSDICPGDTVSLHLEPSGMSVQWSPATGISNPSGYDPVVAPLLTTQYSALLTDSAGCFSDSASFYINVKPPAVVDAGNDLVVGYYSNFNLQPSYSSNIVKYEWSPPGDLNCVFCANPSGRALKSYNYFIRVTSDSGCVSTDSVKVIIECNKSSILVPNAFTPNNDNLNETLYPVGRGVSLIKSFSVYNRYGQLVYRKENFPPNDKTFGWDGRIKGEPAPISVYVFVVEAMCDQGNPIVKKGTVTLIR